MVAWNLADVLLLRSLASSGWVTVIVNQPTKLQRSWLSYFVLTWTRLLSFPSLDPSMLPPRHDMT